MQYASNYPTFTHRRQVSCFKTVTVSWILTDSQGTATNGCHCTVIVVEILLFPEAESPLVLATHVHMRTVYGKISVQKLQLFRYASLQNPQVRNSNLATFNTCNSTGVTCHVLTTFQHVACIMVAKCNHVATVVADLHSQAGAASALRLHCFHQCNEDSKCSLPQHFDFAKANLQDSIKPGLNWFLQMKPRNSS